MDVEAVDEAMEKYFRERMGKGRKTAVRRFLTHCYTRYYGDELRTFMRDVAQTCRYYIDYLKVTENPLKGPELPWFVALVVVAAFSAYLTSRPRYSLLGILLLSGTLAHAWSVISSVIRKWKEVSVLIAIYREIMELAEREGEQEA